MREGKTFMSGEIREAGQLPDFQFVGKGEEADRLKEAVDEIKRKCQEAQDFFGAASEVNTVVISPGEKSSCKIEGDTANLELEDPGSARHEYSHAIIGPLCERLSDSLSAEASQKIFDSLTDEVRRKHVGEDESPEEVAPRLLEEYIVRAGNTHLRVKEEGGEDTVLAEANRKLTETGDDEIKTFPELLERDEDWRLRAFFYEQLKEFQRLKDSGEIDSIEEFLPTVVNNLEK